MNLRSRSSAVAYLTSSWGWGRGLSLAGGWLMSTYYCTKIIVETYSPLGDGIVTPDGHR